MPKFYGSLRSISGVSQIKLSSEEAVCQKEVGLLEM